MTKQTVGTSYKITTKGIPNCAFTLTETEKSFRSEKLSEKNRFHINMQKVTHWSETETETDIPSDTIGFCTHFSRKAFCRIGKKY